MSPTREKNRSFTIADAMILVAAMAAGLSWSGQVRKTFVESVPNPGRTILSNAEWWYIGTTLSLPCLAAMTFAVLVLRVRSPRPRWRKIAREPGMTACLAAVLAMILLGAYTAVMVWKVVSGGEYLFDKPLRLASDLLSVWAIFSPIMGASVLIAWTLLALQRRWKADSGWIDRAGRLVGVLWLVVAGILGTVILLDMI